MWDIITNTSKMATQDITGSLTGTENNYASMSRTTYRPGKMEIGVKKVVLCYKPFIFVFLKFVQVSS